MLVVISSFKLVSSIFSAHGLNNPLKFVDPSGNEGLVAEKIQTTTLKNGASFTAGFTCDAINFATAGLADAADVMAKDAMNGRCDERQIKIFNLKLRITGLFDKI